MENLLYCIAKRGSLKDVEIMCMFDSFSKYPEKAFAGIIDRVGDCCYCYNNNYECGNLDCCYIDNYVVCDNCCCDKNCSINHKLILTVLSKIDFVKMHPIIDILVEKKCWGLIGRISGSNQCDDPNKHDDRTIIKMKSVWDRLFSISVLVPLNHSVINEKFIIKNGYCNDNIYKQIYFDLAVDDTDTFSLKNLLHLHIMLDRHEKLHLIDTNKFMFHIENLDPLRIETIKKIHYRERR